MTEVTIKKTGEGTAEFELEEGCVLCGETLAIRMTPTGAFSVCASCRWISRAEVSMNQGGLSVSYPAAGQA